MSSPDNLPLIIAWDSDRGLSLSEIEQLSRESQAFVGLIPSTVRGEDYVNVYVDAKEFVRVCNVSIDELIRHLAPDQMKQLPVVPKRCVVMQTCNYQPDSLPIHDKNYKRKDLREQLSEPLWDRLVWRLQKLTHGICITPGEGAHDIDCEK